MEKELVKEEESDNGGCFLQEYWWILLPVIFSGITILVRKLWKVFA